MATLEMEENLDLKFENLYKTIVVALKINRSHPDVKRDWKWIVYIVLAHGTFFFIFCVIIYSTIFYEIKNNDFTQACANGVLGLMFNIVTLKYIVMVVYQKTIKEIIAKIDKDYETAKTYSKQEQYTILKFAGKGRLIVKYWTCYAIATACLFANKSIVLMCYYRIFGEFKIVQAYDIHYPPSIEDKKDELHVYLMLYTFFLYLVIYGAVMYVGFVPLVPIFVLHACGQIEVVRTRLLKLFHTYQPEHIIQRNIKDIIIYIQEIHCFVEKIKCSMVFFNELLLKCSSVLIPVAGYQILKMYHVAYAIFNLMNAMWD